MKRYLGVVSLFSHYFLGTVIKTERVYSYSRRRGGRVQKRGKTIIMDGYMRFLADYLQITALELFSESVNAAMDEKYREQLRFKTMRRDFAEDVSYVKNWIIKCEAIAKDKSSTPHIHKEKLQVSSTNFNSDSNQSDL